MLMTKDPHQALNHWRYLKQYFGWCSRFGTGLYVRSRIVLGRYLCYDPVTRHRAGSGAWGRSGPFYRSTQVADRPPRVAPPRNHAHTFGLIRSIGSCLTTCRSMATIYHTSAEQTSIHKKVSRSSESVYKLGLHRLFLTSRYSRIIKSLYQWSRILHSSGLKNNVEILMCIYEPSWSTIK